MVWVASCLTLAFLLLSSTTSAQPRSRARVVNRPPVISHPIALAPGDAVPGLSGRDLGGASISVDWAARKGTLVNFWATWCEPCKIEMPALQATVSAHGDDLAVYGVLLDEVDDNTAREHLTALDVRYPSIRLTLPDLTAWGAGGVLPVTFLVNSEGRLVRRYVGASPVQVRGLEADIAAYLEGRPLPMQVFPTAEDHEVPSGD